jgi:hypothetical protein
MSRGPSSIPISENALLGLIADGHVKVGMYTPRTDGGFNLHVSGELRSKLDTLVVKTGLDYSQLFERFTKATSATEPGALPGGYHGSGA